MGAGAAHPAGVPALLAGQRPGRRAGTHRAAGPGRHGVRPGGRAPPITGLYATIVPLVAYAILGPSRVMVLGPDSSLAAVIAAVILPLGGDDPETAVALAGALAVITGLIILVAGIARLGFVTELLSRPVQLGYLYGIAVTILVGQLPKLCGFSIEGRGLLTEIRDFAQGVADGQVNRAALAVGLAGIVVILVLRRFWRRSPGWRWPWSSASPPWPSSTSRPRAWRSWACSPRASPPWSSRPWTWRTWAPCSAARSASPWSRWPTPPCCRSPWPPSGTRASTPTRSSAPSASPTWPPACSRASPSPAAPPAPRWPCPPAPAPSSRRWWGPSPSPCCWCSRPACSVTSRCRCWPRS